ncbi:MAG: response regulator [Caulobacteraceae bacterium]
MPHPRVLIVEDEILVAMDLEQIVEAQGCEVVGIASDSESAFELARCGVDLALVDVNLRDGETGGVIGAKLAQAGVSVVFTTANPKLVHGQVPDAVGVLGKPCSDNAVKATLAFLSGMMASPPPELTLFRTAAAH